MCCIDLIFVYANGLGPNPVTISDFIQMIWDQRPPVLVMLTHLVEKGKVKATTYVTHVWMYAVALSVERRNIW